MDYIIIELVSEYLLEKNNIVLLTNLYEVSFEIKMFLFSHHIYKKKKAAFLLNKTIKSLELDIASIQLFYQEKRIFKYILNAFYSSSNTNYLYIDQSINTYNLHVFNHKTDYLNPFRRLKLFKRNEFKQRMQNNIILNLALMHADLSYSHAKANIMSEY